MDYGRYDDYGYDERPHRRERRAKEVEYLPHGKDHILERKVIFSEASDGGRSRRAPSPPPMERRYERYDMGYPMEQRPRSPRRQMVQHVSDGGYYGRGPPQPPMMAPMPMMMAPLPMPPPPPRRIPVSVPYPVPVPVYRNQSNGGDMYTGAAAFGPPPQPPAPMFFPPTGGPGPQHYPMGY